MAVGMVSVHEEGRTKPCTLRFVNKSSRTISASWVNFNGQEVPYMQLEGGTVQPQRTYDTHVWRIRFADSGAIVGQYVGPSAALEVSDGGVLGVLPWSETLPKPRPEWGQYAKRGSALGVEIWAYDIVDPRAVRCAEHVVRRMLADSPQELVRRMVDAGARVAVIGRAQVTTDIPAHSFLKWAEGGRDTDSTTRGLGGTEQEPTTSCGEENLLMEDDRFYPSESILVHEFGHTVMNLGLTQAQRDEVEALYQAAHRSGRYDNDSYIMANADEYWAEATQAWFEATIRTDVTSGITTRDQLRAHDPGLAAAMARAYGDGAWRYQHDSPTRLSPRPRASRTTSAIAAAAAASADSMAAAAAAVLAAATGRVSGGGSSARPSSGGAAVVPALQPTGEGAAISGGGGVSNAQPPGSVGTMERWGEGSGSSGSGSGDEVDASAWMVPCASGMAVVRSGCLAGQVGCGAAVTLLLHGLRTSLPWAASQRLVKQS